MARKLFVFDTFVELGLLRQKGEERLVVHLDVCVCIPFVVIVLIDRFCTYFLISLFSVKYHISYHDISFLRFLCSLPLWMTRRCLMVNVMTLWELVSFLLFSFSMSSTIRIRQHG